MSGSTQEDVVELSETKPHDPEREAQAAAEAELTTNEPEPTDQPRLPTESPLLFHDWTIKRAERRVRRLFVALVLLAAVAGAWLAVLQRNISELRETAAVQAPAVQAPAVQAPAVQARDTPLEDAELRRTLFGTGDQSPDDKDVIGDIHQRLSRIERAVTELRRDRSRLSRCVSKELRELDHHLRHVLEGTMSPRRYIARPRPRRCR